MSFKAAAAAMRVVHDKPQNLSRYHALVQEAAASGVKLLVLPELSLQGGLFTFDGGFSSDESAYHWQHAEAIPGPSTAQVQQWAQAHDLLINFGLMERADYAASPVLYNTSVLVGPGGVIGKHRKVHQPLEERIYYRAGQTWTVCDTPLAQIGLMICYDQTFPEAARELTLMGADVLTVPSAWTAIDDASQARYDLFGRARALENNRWLIQSNQVGQSDTSTQVYLGYSRIINPDGVVIAATEPAQEGLAIAAVTPKKLDPRKGYTRWYLQQRRPETYNHLTRPSFPDDEI